MSRLYKREKSWYIDIRLPDGTRIRRSVGRCTKGEAEKILKQIEFDIRQKKYNLPKTDSISLKQFVDEKYLPYVDKQQSKSTYKNKASRLKSLLAFFGDISVISIDSWRVEEYRLSRSVKVCNQSINHEINTLSHVFNKAVEWGIIATNPMKNIKPLSVPKRPPRFLSVDEVSRLLNVLKDTKYYVPFFLILHTGMRRGEMLNLTWDDIDLEKRTLIIQSGKDWHTKNYRYRAIQMTDDLYELLVGLNKKPGKLFPFHPSTVWEVLKKAAKKVEIEGITIHTLRHTFASHLAMAGVPIRAIQELLGHQDYKTTLVYAHLSPEFAQRHTHKLPYSSCAQNVPETMPKDAKKVYSIPKEKDKDIVSMGDYLKHRT